MIEKLRVLASLRHNRSLSGDLSLARFQCFLQSRILHRIEEDLELRGNLQWLVAIRGGDLGTPHHGALGWKNVLRAIDKTDKPHESHKRKYDDESDMNALEDRRVHNRLQLGRLGLYLLALIKLLVKLRLASLHHFGARCLFIVSLEVIAVLLIL